MNEKQRIDFIDGAIIGIATLFLVCVGYALDKIGFSPISSWARTFIFFSVGMFVMRRVAWQIYSDYFVPLLKKQREVVEHAN